MICVQFVPNAIQLLKYNYSKVKLKFTLYNLVVEDGHALWSGTHRCTQDDPSCSGFGVPPTGTCRLEHSAEIQAQWTISSDPKDTSNSNTTDPTQILNHRTISVHSVSIHFWHLESNNFNNEWKIVRLLSLLKKAPQRPLSFPFSHLKHQVFKNQIYKLTGSWKLWIESPSWS